MQDLRGPMITAIGIILSFALAFAGQWALAPGAWLWWHTPPGLALAIGVVVLLSALRLAMHGEMTEQTTRRIIRRLTAGVSAALLGFVLLVLLEAIDQRYGPSSKAIVEQFRAVRPNAKVLQASPALEKRYVQIVFEEQGTVHSADLQVIKTPTGWKLTQ